MFRATTPEALSDPALLPPPYLLAGSALHLVGTILLTDRLARAAKRGAGDRRAARADAESYWTRYLSGWTAWNHVRAAASLVAAATLTIALHVS